MQIEAWKFFFLNLKVFVKFSLFLLTCSVKNFAFWILHLDLLKLNKNQSPNLSNKSKLLNIRFCRQSKKSENLPIFISIFFVCFYFSLYIEFNLWRYWWASYNQLSFHNLLSQQQSKMDGNNQGKYSKLLTRKF